MNKSKPHLPQADRGTTRAAKLPLSFYQKQYRSELKSHRRMARISLIVMGSCWCLAAFLLTKAIAEGTFGEAYILTCLTFFIGLGGLFNTLYSRRHAKKYKKKLKAVQDRQEEALLLRNKR